MISDEELYQLIKKAVRAKRTVPHCQSENFAERYCSQQLAKKKLKNPVKMEHIMKNFSKLDTYFDLPQLITSINQLKATEQTKMVTAKPDDKKIPENAKFKINKHFSDYKNLRYVVENESVQSMLNEMESENEWKSQHVRNNSGYSLGTFFDRLSHQKENDNPKESSMVFEMLQRYMQNRKGFLKEEKEEDIKSTQLNSQKKKQATHFLHKVSSYLQMILEAEHRNKWNSRNKHRSSFVNKNLHTFANIYEQKVKSKFKPTNKPIINPLLSNTKYIEALRQETRKIRQNSFDSSKGQGSQLTNVKRKLKYLSSTLVTAGAESTRVEGQQSSVMEKMASEPSKIKSIFTFKRRSIKQKIISRLEKFIGEIDEETVCSRKENNYYNKEINKLEVQMNHLYGRYQQEAIVGDKDIDNLKELASRFQVNSSKTPLEDNSEKISQNSTQIIQFS